MCTVTIFELNLQGQMGAGWVVMGHDGGGSVSGSQGELHVGTRYIDGLLGPTKNLET